MQSLMPSTRQPAVAGAFYPAHRERLRAQVEQLLHEATLAPLPPIRALIVPHAGYRYSGPIAASGFRQLQTREFGSEPAIYLLGPAHYEPVRSVDLAPYDRFATPLGLVAQDPAIIDDLLADTSTYRLSATAHLPEHCLEVELPFLQVAVEGFRLVAMLCGRPDIDRVAADLAARLGADDLVLVSSDLSHFHGYQQASTMDRSFLRAVVEGDQDLAQRGEACGLQPILILMRLAQLQGWQATLLDYRNSGDTAGDRQRVVGYAAVAYTAIH